MLSNKIMAMENIKYKKYLITQTLLIFFKLFLNFNKK